MMFSCGLLLLFLSTVRTGYSDDNRSLNRVFDGSISYSYWPSIHNAARMMRIRKREAEQIGQNEGGGVKLEIPSTKVAEIPSTKVAEPNPHAADAKEEQQQPHPQVEVAPSPSVTKPPVLPSNKTQTAKEEIAIPKVPGAIISNKTVSLPQPIVNTTKSNLNDTVAESSDKIDLSGPGVVKRGAIVFGGFALLAIAYFIFYRRKSKKNDPNSTHNAIDANQFRYGVLQSEDRRDNMELSRVPLTMESDDDEDDDLEIFDLEQKKKSLSYVNLQLNDEEVVNGQIDSKEDEGDNLLLDIEDANTDPLINWSNNGNKSIL